MAEDAETTNEIEDKKEFLLKAARKLEFKGLVNEEICYMFCGDGEKYVQFILQLYPRVRKVCFTNFFDSFNAEYNPRRSEVLGINAQDISDLSFYKGYFPHLISMDCFHWYKSARNGFNIIHHLLKLGGTAAILMNINSPFEDCFKDLIENSQWKYTGLNQESPFPKFPARLGTNEYKELAEAVGFTVVDCEKYYRIYECEGLLEFFEKCMNFISPLLAYLPKEHHRIFKNDYLDKFKQFHGVSRRGNQRIKYKTLALFIRKPAPLPAAPPPPPPSPSTSSPYYFSYIGGRFN